jgi:hypothetical protein
MEHGGDYIGSARPDKAAKSAGMSAAALKNQR